MMREQIAHPAVRSVVPRRATAQQSIVPTNPHRARHQAGLHPEDQPYQSTDIEEDDSYYQVRETRLPSSSIRYQTTDGSQVIQQGNRRIIIHEGPPPKTRKRVHWLFFLGLGVILMILVWVGLSQLSAWWASYQLDSQYGFPRTYQTDARVGFGDEQTPTHFIALNLNGEVEVIVCPAGNCAKAVVYQVVRLFGSNANAVPVTLSFANLTNSGHLDMVVHIGDQQIIFKNTGNQFKQD